LLPDVFSSSDDFNEWFDLGGKKQTVGDEGQGEQNQEIAEDKEKHNNSVID